MTSVSRTPGKAAEQIANGILDFMVRSRAWTDSNSYWHVRQLCEDRVVENTQTSNAVFMLHFAEECRSEKVREHSRHVLLNSFEHVFEQPGLISQLSFLQLTDLVSSPELRVQTESHVCDAIVKWLELVHGSKIAELLAEREELERISERSIPPREREDQVYHTIEGDVHKLRLDVAQQDATVAALESELSGIDQEIERLEIALLVADQGMLDSARELGGYSSQEILLTVYRNAKPRVERLMTCVSVLLGLDPVWDITQRMCYEGKLVPRLLEYNYHVVEPAMVSEVFRTLSKPAVFPEAMSTKPARAMAGWAHAAARCVQLSTDIVNEKAARACKAEELRVGAERLGGMRSDLEGLRLLEAGSTDRFVDALRDEIMAKLRVELCEARLVRTARKLDQDASVLLAKVRWPLVAKEYIRGELLQLPFVARYLPPGSKAGAVLQEGSLVPMTEFLRMAESQGGGQRDVYGRKGRRLTGESAGTVAQVVMCPLRPREAVLERKEWAHACFMASPRAFACAGVLPARVTAARAGEPGREGGCLVVCGGYDELGQHLNSVEGAQVPECDHFAALPRCTCPRSLGSIVMDAEDGTVWVVGGYDEHGFAVETAERFSADISFDSLGGMRVLKNRAR